MATLSMRPCLTVGCGLYAVKSGRCDKHQPLAKIYEKHRGTSTQRGYGAKWRKERLVYLNDNPLCIACKRLGVIIAATVVDHVVPHKGDSKLFWRRSNWQAMCESCHNRKTATEDMGNWQQP